jgi:hypothetical protein
VKKIIALAFLSLLLSSALNGQKSFMKFGKIPKENLSMTSYEKDTTAGAVILGDFGVTRFEISQDEGFFMVFTRHIRIKILDKTELDWGDFSIRLYQGDGGKDEDLSMIKGKTYNLENGKVVKTKLSRNAIFREEEDKNHDLIKFAMPNVKEGSVIDVTYSINSPFLFTLQPWYFQKSIPVARSEYHVYIPEYFYYKNWTTGYIRINKESESHTESYQYNRSAEINSQGRQSGGIVNFDAQVEHWTYTAENVPAFINEPYITTAYDYLGAIEFELVSTNFPGSPTEYYTHKWEEINKEMLDDPDFGKQLDNTGHLKSIIEQIESETTDPLERMKLAYEHIKDHIRWDKRYRIWPTTNIRKAYNDGEGSSADINLNLVALLKGLSLDADPVLISTRSNGMLKPGQVILTQFNHVVTRVQIEGKEYVLDAIDYYCPYTILPSNSLNGKGLVIRPEGNDWVELYADVPDVQVHFVKAKMNEDLSITGEYKVNLNNFSALALRKKLYSFTEDEEYIEELEKENEGLTISSFNIEKKDSFYYPLKIFTQYELTDRVTEGGDFIYFIPLFFERLKENPFRNDKRDFPIDYNYPIDFKYISYLTLPEGYQVEEIPESLMLKLPNQEGKFIYDVKELGNQLVINCTFQRNQTIYPSSEYEEIKKFYEQIVKKQAEQIVLKKIN